MKKKLIGILLAVIMAVSLGTGVLASDLTEPAVGSPDFLATENFDGDFTVYNYNWATQAQILDLSGNKVMSVHNYLPEPAGKANPAVSKIATLSKKMEGGYMVVKAKMMVPNVAPTGETPFGGATPWICLDTFNFDADKGAGNTEDLVFGMGITATNNGVKGSVNIAGYSDVSVPYDITADTWYDVMFLANCEARTGDVYINGKRVARTIPFQGGGSQGAVRYPYSIVALPARRPQESITVPAGSLLGDGTRTSETKAFFGNPYPGYIDDVRAYTITEEKALAGEQYIQPSDEEGVKGYYVWEDFSSCLPGKDISGATLSHHWKCYATGEEINGNMAAKMLNNTSEGPAVNMHAASIFSAEQTDGYAVLKADVMLENKNSVANVSFGNLSFGKIDTQGIGSHGGAITTVSLHGGTMDEGGHIAVACGSKDRSSTPTPSPIEADILPGVWHHVEIIADVENEQFDVIVNGKLVMTDAYYGFCDERKDKALRSVIIGNADGENAAYFDNLMAMDVTAEYAMNELYKGFVGTMGNGYPTADVELPRTGWAKPEDCHYDLSLVGAVSSLTLIAREYGNEGNPNEMFWIYVDRPTAEEGDENATVKLEFYDKYGFEYKDYDIPLTILHKLNPVPGVEGAEADVLKLTKSGNTYNAEILFVNGTMSDIPCRVAIAVYDGKELKDFEITTVSALRGAGTTLSAALTYTAGGKDIHAKAFIWSEKGLKAYAKPAKL